MKALGIPEVDPAVFWYLVGLMATDGNLSKDGRHLCLVSNDVEILRDIKDLFRIKAKIATKWSSYNKSCPCTYLQFGNVVLYKKLLAIGLTPNKSLSLGSLDIQDDFFHDFLRGVIDGDGNINSWIHPNNGHVQWELRIYSAAPVFSRWLFDGIEGYFGVRGILLPKGTQSTFRLKFGKLAARVILSACYYEGCLAIPRKQRLAEECVMSYRGWSRSKTVISRGGEIGRTHET